MVFFYTSNKIKYNHKQHQWETYSIYPYAYSYGRDCRYRATKMTQCDSGSHLLVASENNRRFIGCELDKNYFNIAKQRFEQN